MHLPAFVMMQSSITCLVYFVHSLWWWSSLLSSFSHPLWKPTNMPADRSDRFRCVACSFAAAVVTFWHAVHANWSKLKTQHQRSGGERRSK
jgi:hypothetical protein